MAHYRALSYHWHLSNKAWFKKWLPHLRGPGPLARIEKMAELHGVDLAGVETNSREAWKTIVRKATMVTATAEVNKTLDERGEQLAEPFLKPRRYVVQGGARARVGIKCKWDYMQYNHPKLTPLGAAPTANDENQ